MPADRSAATEPRCDFCGLLGWTVEKYGRVTHKQACPHRADPWHQGDPTATAATRGVCVACYEWLGEEGADWCQNEEHHRPFLVRLRRGWSTNRIGPWFHRDWRFGWLGNGWNRLALGPVSFYFGSGPSPLARLRSRLGR